MAFGGGPELTQEQLCQQCCMRKKAQQKAQRTYDAQKQRILQTFSKPRSEPGFWVSRDWVDLWKSVYSPLSGDISPDMTQGIICPHNCLLPARAHARLIPQSCFRILRAYFPEGPEFPEVGSEPCTVCGEEAGIEAAQRLERVRERSAEKFSQDALYKRSRGVQSLNIPVGRYFMLPTSWLLAWRQYLDDASLVTPPPPIPLSHLVCEAHGGCVLSINDPADDCRDRWMLTEQRSFEMLVEKYGIDGSPVVYFVNPGGKAGLHSTEPALCRECAAARQEADLETDTRYSSADVWVSLHGHSETWPRASNNERLADLLPGANPRERRRQCFDRTKLIVSSCDALQLLKLRVFERMSVPIHKQELHCRLGNMCRPVHDPSDPAVLDSSTLEPSLLAELLDRRIALAKKLAKTLPTEPGSHPESFAFGVSLCDAIALATALSAQLADHFANPLQPPLLSELLASVVSLIQRELTFDPDQLTLGFWKIRKGDTVRLLQTSGSSGSSSKKRPDYDAFTKTKLADDITPDRSDASLAPLEEGASSSS